ncbi:MAG: hypothetical protein SFT68_00365 [Rickettsiaceae bacterium]|nr:hypothetical protein [Rickettsiaceae bacterium]
MKSCLPDLSIIDITPASDSSLNIINFYSKDLITIRDQKISTNVGVTPNTIVTFDSCAQLFEIASELNKTNQDMIFIFGGSENYITDFMKAKSTTLDIYLEIMNLGAAVRTYNSLALDGRDVCAFFELENGKK